MARVSVLGLGILGSAVALRLVDQGFSVTVWSRSIEKRRSEFRENGAQVVEHAAEAIRASEVIILLLSDFDAISSTLATDEAKSSIKSKTVVQMGTIGVAQSIDISNLVSECGGRYIEAPVQGSQGEAKAGCLQIMLATSDSSAEDLLPATSAPSAAGQVLAALGQQRILVGPIGSAAALKLSVNHLLAAETAAFSSSLRMAAHNGVPTETFMEVVRGSALYAKQFDKKLSKMLSHDYANANFHTQHLLKDLSLFAGEARAAQLNTSALEGLLGVLNAAMQRGFATSDYSAIHEGTGPNDQSEP